MANDVQERLYRLVVDGTQAVAQLKKIGDSTQSIDQRFQRLGSSLRTAMGFLAAGGIAKGILDNAEKLNTLSASLSVLRGSAAEGADAMNQIFDIVDDTGASLDSVSQGFQRLSIGLKSLGANNDQIALITENFIKLGRIGGASMEDISESIVQFGQALSSGVLQGDEFKSISERFPLLMQKLADEIGVTTGELKKMGSAGKLTSDVLANTLLKVTEQVNEEFAKLPETVDQGMNRIKSTMAQLDQQFFNNSEAGVLIARSLKVVNEELKLILNNSDQWKAISDDVGASIKQLATFFIDSVKEVKLLIAYMDALAKAVKAVAAGNATLFNEIQSNLAKTQASINMQATREKNILAGVKGEMDGLADSVDDYAKSTAGLLEPPPAIADAGKAAKEANKELKALQSTWDSLFKKVQTPDEQFAELSADLDKVEKAGIASAEAIARVREELDKTRDKANEALRVEQLTQFQKGWEDAATSLKEAGDEAEQLKGKLSLVDQLRNVQELNSVYLQLAESLGDSATAADQVAVAVSQVTKEEANVAALTAEFEKLKEANILTAKQLEKVKEKLGGLGDKKGELDELGVAVGQTLSNSVGSFVDALTSSEGDINAWFANLIMQIGKLLIQMALLQAAKAALGGSPLGAFFGFAKGGSFSAGTGLPQGVYNSPQLFKFAHGGTFGRTGVLGEAGPEAVVPLKTTANGDLGVQASPVNVVVNNYTDTQVEVAESNREDGTRDVEITITRIVKQIFGDGSMDQTMRSNYNLPRAGR